MNNVLLVTWYENNNYGTSLQAYSLKAVIEDPSVTGLVNADDSMKRKCELLPHNPCGHSRSSKLEKLFSPHAYVQKLQQLSDAMIRKRNRELFQAKEEAFRRFNKDNFTFAVDHSVQDVDELQRIGEQYDLVISGSDQIWNPEALDETYMIGWVESGKKCSYGSSLSVNHIPQDMATLYRESLAGFKGISIRDTACRTQLESIVGRTVTTVVDPVVLLGPSALGERAADIQKHAYAFCYFLGNNRGHRRTALKDARQLGLEPIAVINSGSDYRADRDLRNCADWDVDPWKFAGYIKNASLVFTDSFHATVISVLMHVDFAVRQKDASRPEQNNRILEFLDAVGLRDRWELRDVSQKISPEQWKRADAAIDEMRRSSLSYLLEVLS